jgi:RNA recognition motif-containing protein
LVGGIYITNKMSDTKKNEEKGKKRKLENQKEKPVKKQKIEADSYIKSKEIKKKYLDKFKNNKKKLIKQNIRREKIKTNKENLSKYLEEKTIFVGNITDRVTEELLKKIFSKYGNIKQIRYLYNSVHKLKKSCCYIEFEDEISGILF